MSRGLGDVYKRQGRISEHQQKMLKHQVGHIESLTALIVDLDADIKKRQNP